MSRLPLSDNRSARIAWAIVFALLFVMGGTFVPAFAVQYAPMDTHFRADSYTVHEPVAANSTNVTITFTRYSAADYPAYVYSDLVRDNPDQPEAPDHVDSTAFRSVADRGKRTYVLTQETPPLEPGTYHFSVVVSLELSHGVTRTVQFESNHFVVVNSTAS